MLLHERAGGGDRDTDALARLDGELAGEQTRDRRLERVRVVARHAQRALTPARTRNANMNACRVRRARRAHVHELNVNKFWRIEQ